MRGFLIRFGLNVLGLYIASRIIPGLSITGLGTFVVAALLLGFVNAVVRPVLVVLTLPITVLTLGLFLLVINAAMLGLVAWLLPGFALSGFGAAALGTIVVGLTGWAGSAVVGERGQIDIMVIERGPGGRRIDS